jgi:2-phospho-L-lactate/phosphoenolpyruvate guanylyltransferase
MAGVVVPFRGPDGKSRLSFGPGEARAELARAMLSDVLEAAKAVGSVVLVTSDEEAARLGADVVHDPGRGQGAAVTAGLERLPDGPALVVNADLPCATPRDLLALLGSMPPGGMAFVPAADGTTNALALSSPRRFASLYGAGSAERFAAQARDQGVECVKATIPNLVDDVDTAEDLARLAQERLGPRTKAALDSLRVGAWA